MATTKHIATIDGQTFTRNSKSRVYTHCVVAKPSIDHALATAQSEGARDLYRCEYRWHQKAVTSGGRLFEQSKHMTDEDYHEQCKRDLMFARRALVGKQSEDDFVSYHVDDMLAWIEKQREQGFYDRWVERGWNSRLDLAQKLAATTRAHPYYGDVVILEATQL